MAEAASTPPGLKAQNRTRRRRTYTIFSVDGSFYQRWQADLLSYSHRKVGQPRVVNPTVIRKWPANPLCGSNLSDRAILPPPD